MDDRKPRVTEPDPNASLMASKVILPQLTGSIDANSSAKFACAVYGQPAAVSFSKENWLQSLNIPREDELKGFASKTVRVACNDV